MRRAAFLALFALAACAGTLARAQAIPALYPEGPLYQGDSLYYAEMGGDRVQVVEHGAPRVFFTQRGCGPTALAPYGEGFLVLCHLGRRVVEISRDGRAVRSWEQDHEGHTLRDPNDAFADGHGGVYFSDPGTFSRQTTPHGRVMYLSPGGVLSAVAGPLWYPNGVFVDRARGQLYVSEHMAGRVLRFDIREGGGLGPAQTFADVMRMLRRERYETPYAEAGPDGLEMDAQGNLWVAIYGEGRILKLSPQSRLLGMLELPARYSTNIAFAPDGGAATTGAFNNLRAPFPGEVRFHTREALTRAAE